MVKLNKKYFGEIDRLQTEIKSICVAYIYGQPCDEIVKSAYRIANGLLEESSNPKSPLRPFRAAILGEIDYMLLITSRFANGEKVRGHKKLSKTIAIRRD